MADVAQLKIAVDSVEVRKAARDLERLAKAASEAEQSIDGLIKIARHHALLPKAIEITSAVGNLSVKHRVEL
jgi:hypothetical protein